MGPSNSIWLPYQIQPFLHASMIMGENVVQPKHISNSQLGGIKTHVLHTGAVHKFPPAFKLSTWNSMLENPASESISCCSGALGGEKLMSIAKASRFSCRGLGLALVNQPQNRSMGSNKLHVHLFKTFGEQLLYFTTGNAAHASKQL